MRIATKVQRRRLKEGKEPLWLPTRGDGQGLPSTTHELVEPLFQRAFRGYGLADVIRTDNRSSSLTGRGTVRLAGDPPAVEAACMVDQDRGVPGAHPARASAAEWAARAVPQDAEGRDSSAACLKPKSAAGKFNRFVREYNEQRPHESLGQETPASVYRPSFRPYPGRIPELEYPTHFERRLVSRNGGIRWGSGWVNVSQVLSEEYVGLEEVDDEVWAVYFGPLLLGRFDERALELHGGYPHNKPL